MILSKKLLLVLIVFSLVAAITPVCAQIGANPIANQEAEFYKKKSKDKPYFILSAGGNYFSLNQPQGLFSTSFLYKSTDVTTGTITTNTFNSSLKNAFSNKPLVFNINLELVWKNRNFIDIGFNTTANYVNSQHEPSYNFEIGYGKIIPVYLSQQRESPAFLIKPALNITSIDFRHDLGVIDNNNKDIDLLGYSISHMIITQSEDDDGNPYPPDTAYATTLNVGFTQRTVMLKPQISITNNPYTASGKPKRLFFGITLSYLFPVSQQGGVSLYQDVTTEQVASSDAIFTRNDATSTFNGNVIKKTPYTAKGFMLGINAGIYFGR